MGLWIFLVFKKFPCLSLCIPNCTWNHLITEQKQIATLVNEQILWATVINHLQFNAFADQWKNSTGFDNVQSCFMLLLKNCQKSKHAVQQSTRIGNKELLRVHGKYCHKQFWCWKAAPTYRCSCKHCPKDSPVKELCNIWSSISSNRAVFNWVS